MKFKTHDGRLNHNSNTAGKLPGDDAGHLFADQFGGSPDLDNLVSQRSDLNRAVKIQIIIAVWKGSGQMH